MLQGAWGTYRHIKLANNSITKPRTDNCFANVAIKGDLSSFQWIEGPFNKLLPSSQLINIHYNAINFRDVMLATGRIHPSEFSDMTRLQSESVLGFEFSGVDVYGVRKMGTSTLCSIGTQIIPNEFTWKIPDEWSLQEAATVPVVYLTVYLAFFHTTKIFKGKSILIHAGSGGIGLAAIRVALAYDLDVYTTVSSVEKKNYILNLFPQLKGKLKK